MRLDGDWPIVNSKGSQKTRFSAGSGEGNTIIHKTYAAIWYLLKDVEDETHFILKCPMCVDLNLWLLEGKDIIFFQGFAFLRLYDLFV